ncbi:hypothetical protein ACWD4V_13790 [Streptomyces tsukubensis]
MPFFAGGRLVASQLQRALTKVEYAVGSGSVLGPATNADITGAAVTFTTETAGAAYAAFAVWDVDINTASTATGTARISVDGTPQSPLATFGAEVATDRFTTCQNYKGTLAAAGTHTIKLIASPGTEQRIQGMNSSILVLVFEVV